MLSEKHRVLKKAHKKRGWGRAILRNGDDGGRTGASSAFPYRISPLRDYPLNPGLCAVKGAVIPPGPSYGDPPELSIYKWGASAFCDAPFAGPQSRFVTKTDRPSDHRVIEVGRSLHHVTSYR